MNDLEKRFIEARTRAIATDYAHLKPRQLAKPRGSIVAEIWFAPSLQYLPVRIRITQGEGSYVDLLVQTIDQR